MKVALATSLIESGFFKICFTCSPILNNASEKFLPVGPLSFLKHKDSKKRTATCEVKALVDATPISGPA